MADYYLDYRGNDYNGGGYDASISGATVNLASGQYAALTASGLECVAGTTEITSVHGGFTTDMIGNTINIYNGYDFTYNHYFISGVPDANTILVDTIPATGGVDAVSGVGKVGGAWRSYINWTSGGGSFQWTGKRQIVRPSIVHIKGNGSQNPPSGQYPAVTYCTMHSSSQQEPLVFRGYNGRPAFAAPNGNLFLHSGPFAIFENIKFIGGQGGYETSIAQINGGYIVDNCIFDQRGTRAMMLGAAMIRNCYFCNSRIEEVTNKTGQHAVSSVGSYGYIASDNVYENCVGTALQLSVAFATNNVINNQYGTGIKLLDNGGYTNQARFNTINNATGDGIQRGGNLKNTVIGNLITNCSGVAIKELSTYTNTEVTSGVTSAQIDFNVFYNNNVLYSGYQGGYNDIVLTSTPYLNEAAGDLTLNFNAGGGKDARGAVSMKTAGYGKSQSYQDAGALQSYGK